MRRKLTYGVGVNDAPYATESDKTVDGITVHSRKCPYFMLWKGMLRRCYGNQTKENPSYLGCTVDECWHSFMSFKSWIENQVQHDLWLSESELPVKQRSIKFQLDKDLLGNGKLYSPNTCVLIPSTLNSVLSHPRDVSKDLPLGVSWMESRLKYRAYVMVENRYKSLGYYENPMLAHQAWQNAKCENILRLILEYEKEPYHDKRVVMRFHEIVQDIMEDISNLQETKNFKRRELWK